jgi:lysophospholipid acyltransferase (LPLAT)-like uncharacterized protein
MTNNAVGTENMPKAPCIVVFWHQHLLAAWWYVRKIGGVALVSPSADGSLLASVLQRWGYTVWRGSSSKTTISTTTLANMARHECVSITPDGPRGPKWQAKAGAAIASYRAQVPLVLVGVRYGKAHRVHSWDSFMIPWPASTLAITTEVLTPPIPDSSPEDVDRWVALVQERLYRTRNER